MPTAQTWGKIMLVLAEAVADCGSVHSRFGEKVVAKWTRKLGYMEIVVCYVILIADITDPSANHPLVAHTGERE